MDKLYRVVIIDDDEFSADNLCLELKKYNRLSIDCLLYTSAGGREEHLARKRIGCLGLKRQERYTVYTTMYAA